MRRRFPLAYSAALAWHVDLPTYNIVAGSFLPIRAALTHADGIQPGATVAAVLATNPTVMCDIPDEYAGDDEGNVDVANLRRLYKGNARFDRPDYTPPKPDRPIPR